MKLQASELPIGTKPQARRKTSKLAPLVALTILLTIPLYYPSIRSLDLSNNRVPETIHNIDAFELPLNREPPPHDLDHEPSNADQDIRLPCSIDSEEQCNEKDSKNDEEQQEHETVVPNQLDGEQEHGTVVPNQLDGEQEHETIVSNQLHGSTSSVRKRREKGGRRKRLRRQSQHVVSPPKQNTLPSQHNPEKRQKFSTVRNRDRTMILRSKLLDKDKCDVFSGEWVPDPFGPYYTNETCNAIQEHQNCMKFGRPDLGFLKWRWKPDDCELPLFDPDLFLELVRGKSLAFVGDSVARNHMQSLVCLLSRVSYPVDLSDNPIDQNRRYEYRDYDFNISMFWSPYLVRTEKSDPSNDKLPFNLFLDEPDPHWTTRVAGFDYVIISAGHWFFRPTYFYLNRTLTGCLYCPEPDINHLTSYFSYRRAFRTSFRAVSGSNFDGVAFLRSFAPSHFEGGRWDKGGDCVRTRPFSRNETDFEDYSLEMYTIQLEELEIARRGGGGDGDGGRFRFRLFDATKVMLLRPDGHPSKYGHWQVPNQTFANDCVHWCLPGPIDAWNDLLQEMLKRESWLVS